MCIVLLLPHYIGLGKYNEAIEELKKAIEILGKRTRLLRTIRKKHL
jgi:hypothetical protein